MIDLPKIERFLGLQTVKISLKDTPTGASTNPKNFDSSKKLNMNPIVKLRLEAETEAET